MTDNIPAGAAQCSHQRQPQRRIDLEPAAALAGDVRARCRLVDLHGGLSATSDQQAAALLRVCALGGHGDAAEDAAAGDNDHGASTMLPSSRPAASNTMIRSQRPVGPVRT